MQEVKVTGEWDIWQAWGGLYSLPYTFNGAFIHHFLFSLPHPGIYPGKLALAKRVTEFGFFQVTCQHRCGFRGEAGLEKTARFQELLPVQLKGQLAGDPVSLVGREAAAEGLVVLPKKMPGQIRVFLGHPQHHHADAIVRGQLVTEGQVKGFLRHAPVQGGG